METFDINLKISAGSEKEANLIARLFKSISQVKYETLLKLAQKNEKNPKGIMKILSHPLVKANL